MPENRDNSGRFSPGQSGNPGGRPAGLRAKINSLTNDGNAIVGFIVDVMNGRIDVPIKHRMDAAIWLAERLWGRIDSTVAESTGDVTIQNASAKELLREKLKIRAERSANQQKPMGKGSSNSSAK